MRTHAKKIIVASLAAATLSIGIAANYERVVYLHDCALALYIRVAETIFPSGGSLTVVDHRIYRRHVRTFRDLPRGFMHAGGLLVYMADRDIRLKDVAAQAVRYTGYFRASRLAGDIREYNGLRVSEVHAGSILVIPGASPSLVPDARNRTMPDLITARGLYFSITSVGSGLILKNLGRYRALGINTIVFDVKDIPGIVGYCSRVPAVRGYNTHEKRSIDNIDTFIRILKANGFYTVARIAVFHDRLLRKRDPGLAIRSKRGGIWNPGDKEKWCDPTNKKVQDYNISIALELADMGVDEIQFDYIRFPTTGNIADADFTYDFGRMSRAECITHFLKRAHGLIAARNARLSIDIFGVVAWGKPVDINSTGQRIELLAPHCDVISPMLYPSHFNDDFDGYAKPGDNPYYFIHSGCRKVLAMAVKHAIVRPWLQAFRWRVSNYNRKYILTQIQATNDSGAKGWLFWNASNDYGTVLNALEDMNGSKEKP
ncbi:MAG: hypothetical protein JW807_03675 [Spirochaetes bacterium]|nr:hypothetical protein [Spirochaetota bacterium]